MKKLLRVLQILISYRNESQADESNKDEQDGLFVDGGMIYMSGPMPEKMSPEHAEELHNLGMFYSKTYQSWHTLW